MFGFLPGFVSCGQQSAAVYRSHFCGLAGMLSSEYGVWSRCLINRDSTALALLGTALSESPPQATASTCCNPLAAPRPMFRSGPAMRYAAAVTICGLAAKLEDDDDDEGVPRRILAAGLGHLLEDAFSKAAGTLHALAFPVPTVIEALHAGKNPTLPWEQSFRATGAAFGEIYAHLGTLTGSGPEARSALCRIGSSLGFLTHAKDAWDDWESDQRQGRFNPMHGLASREDRLAALSPLALAEAGQIRRAFASLPLRRHRDLLEMALVQGTHDRVNGWMSTAKRKNRVTQKGRARWWDNCDPCSGCSSGSDCGSLGRGTSVGCDLNPCDGDGCGCGGCDCPGCDCSP